MPPEALAPSLQLNAKANQRGRVGLYPGADEKGNQGQAIERAHLRADEVGSLGPVMTSAVHDRREKR
jgi:hypothetical protein